MQPDKLEKHMFATYLSLRVGMAVLGIVLPLVLYLGGKILGISLQESMSDYYHATAADGRSMRDWFVGLLFAIGAFLYLYKGFSTLENWLLNFAGLFAIGVALFPVQNAKTAHTVSAVLFFLCIASVCFFCAKDTLKDMENQSRKKWYRGLYWTMASVMLLSPVIALLFSLFLQQMRSYVYCVEAAGIWAFAAYWLIKSWELRETKAERRALRMTV